MTFKEEDLFRITETTYYEFLKRFQEGVEKGYKLSEAMYHFPSARVGLYTCVLVKEQQEVSNEVLEVSTDKPNAQHKGRPKTKA